MTLFLILVTILVVWEESSRYMKPITEDFMMVCWIHYYKDEGMNGKLI